MSHVAVIVGISGNERFLARENGETAEKKRARRFRSEDSAKRAAESHIVGHAPVIARALSYRVESEDAAA
jgi:hypothetical protein